MSLSEAAWEKKLKIQTAGRVAAGADDHHHPYEPTPYKVLERLAESGYLDAENTIVDYGSGKGRVCFFLHHAVGCHAVGLEYDPTLYGMCLDNLHQYKKEAPITFLCENAKGYQPDTADCFYFFNPFTVELLKSVLSQIRKSWYEHPRQMRLFFYYPDQEYVAYLMTVDELIFLDEIDCQDLFGKADERERILLFETGSL